MKMVLQLRLEFDTDMPHASPSAIINLMLQEMLKNEQFASGCWPEGLTEKWDGRIKLQNPAQGSTSEYVQAQVEAKYRFLDG